MPIFEISLGGVTLAPTYYGLMYVVGFILGYLALKKTKHYSASQLESLFFYIFAGVVLGGRLGYVLFYNLPYYLGEPSAILRVWEGGMSFHGGLIGVIAALIIFARRQGISFLSLADDMARVAPIGLFFGRIGNYINKELLGFSYTGPLAVVTETGSYFPSPLVEAILEGIILYIILNTTMKPPKFPGQVGSVFLILYGIFRLIVELFIRQPDAQIGYYFGFITQGALLSGVMIVLGLTSYYFLLQQKRA